MAAELKTNNMTNTPFKLKSGNSPLSKGKTSWKEFFGMIKKDTMMVPKYFVKSVATTAKKVATDVAKTTKSSKKKEAKTGFTSRKI